MKVLFISNVYPPEVAPLANRLSEHAKTWVEAGVSLEVVCPNPNYPEGELYPGFNNEFNQTVIDDVLVTRVKTLVTANKGFLKRTLSYISFMLAAIFSTRKLVQRPEVVVASSPHIFSAVAGLVISRRLKIPFVLEIRDLWPESIVAVGASKRNWLIRRFEALEQYLYECADLIIPVTDTFKTVIVGKGISPEKIVVIKNGAVVEDTQAPSEFDLNSLRDEHDLHGKFVVSYIGTIGMAHSVPTIVEAARQSEDKDVVFLVAGSGAERSAIEKMIADKPLSNFRLLGKVPKHVASQLMALSDASVVHLKDTPVFKTVLPSKLFDAMVARKPILLGVRGESQALVEAANAGLAFEPENSEHLIDAIMQLKSDSDKSKAMGDAGYKYLTQYHDRKLLASRYLDAINALLGKRLPNSREINELAA